MSDVLPTDPFEMYEPRPKYKVAAPLTATNLVAVAERINYLSGCGAADVVALVQPGSRLILQTRDGDEIGWAYPGDYIVKTKDSYAAIKGHDFALSHRKCVGDER